MTVQNAEGAFLSRRQTEIVGMLVSGKSTREIALALTLSPRTVESHIAAIYNKYGVISRTELMLAVLGPSVGGRPSVTLPVADEVKTNLPVRRGQLIGRAQDSDNIVGLLRANQLVTLTGAGGIGKTQAALAVGEALLEQFRHGVWLVELAALAEGSSVSDALSRALSIQGAKDVPLVDAIVAYLQRKMLLLVIDNCEHLIGDVAVLADRLMRNCPRLQILTTSREPLRIAGEQTYRLPSLAVPAGEDVATLRAARGPEYAAVELFTQRAQAVDFRFALDDENTPVVAEICRKIDGIPLAIELAAARVKILSLGILATKIDSHLRILAGGDRLALPRHRTMHALIDWSYHLLSPAEQRLFECLSVFAGGCALEQVAAVYSGKTDDEDAILNLLSSLVDKSLLVVELESGEPRYSLLQLFGQYAFEKLESHGESIVVRQRHAHAYTACVERLEQEFERAPTELWYARAASEFENLSAALEWTLGARRDVALGQRLVAAMRPEWLRAGVGQRWVQIARDLADERTPPFLAAQLDDAAAWAGFTVGDYQATLATSLRVSAVYRELGEPVRAAHAQSLAAYSLLFLGRPAEAEPLLAPALEVGRSHGYPLLTAFLLRASSNLSALRGDTNGSRQKLAEALALYERIGADRHATLTIGALAEREFQAGNSEYAFDLATRSLNLQRGYGRRRKRIVPSLVNIANIAAYSVALERWDHARAYARETLSLAREVPHATAEMLALQHLAAAAVLSARDDASSAATAGAAQLLGYVDAFASARDVAREYTEQQEYDRVLAALRAAVPADDLARLLAQGATLRLEQAIELALSI